MRKKKTWLLLIIIVTMGLILSGCGGGGGGGEDISTTPAEKEQVRTEVSSFIDYIAVSEDTAEAEIDKIQDNVASDAEIVISDVNGQTMSLTKDEYITISAALYSDGYQVESYKIENMVITVNSAVSASANFKLLQTTINSTDEIYTEVLVKLGVVKQSGSWVVNEYRTGTQVYQENPR